MTYKQLAEKIISWPKELQELDVTVHSSSIDEFFAAGLQFVGEDDVNSDILDVGHPYLESKELA